MPEGLNRTDLNTDHKNYRLGTQMLLPFTYGTPVNTATHNFGNPVTLPKNFGNPVTLPHTFGNNENLSAGN